MSVEGRSDEVDKQTNTFGLQLFDSRELFKVVMLFTTQKQKLYCVSVSLLYDVCN